MARRPDPNTALSRRRLLRRAAAGSLAVAARMPPFAPSNVSADAPANVTIGASVQGRPIIATHLGNGPARVLVLGGIHTGDEANTVDLVTAFIQFFLVNPTALPAAASLTLIPALNVDGLLLGTRTNARDVDLNRNWPARWQPQAVHGEEVVSGGAAPLSEPETAALYATLRALRPHAVLSWHSAYPPSGAVEGNAAVLAPTREVTGKTLARAFAADAGADDLDEWIEYPITGQLLDTLEVLGLPGMDVELPSHDGIFLAENLAGLRRVINDVITVLG